MGKNTKKTDQTEDYSTLNGIRYVYKNIYKYNKVIFSLIFFVLLSNVVNALIPMILPKIFIDSIIENKGVKYMLIVALIYGGLVLIFGLMSIISNGILDNQFIISRLGFIKRLGEKVMTMDFENLENPKILDALNKSQRAGDSNNIGIEGVMRHSTMWFERIIMVFTTSVIIFTLNPYVIIFCLIFVIYSGFVTYKSEKIYKKIDDKCTPLWRKEWYYKSKCQDFIVGKDVRIFTLGSLLSKKHRETVSELFKHRKYRSKKQFVTDIFFSLGSFVQSIFIYGVLCYMSIKGKITIGELTMYVAAIESFIENVSSVINTYVYIQAQNRYVNDYRAFLAIPDKNDGNLMINDKILNSDLTFRFENVSFKYPGTDKFVLKNFNATIKPNEKLAIVGLNGAGKSTFVKLLIKLYRPTEGTIYLNDIDINKYKNDEYYKLFSTVFQEIMIFAFSIGENISMNYIENIDKQKLEKVCENSGIKDKIYSYKNKYNTFLLKNIDENGIDLSGGERQKIALARALYKNGKVLILDEPTSALDAIAEENIYNKFNKFANNKTAIYISHRLASTRFCDRILVFKDGECVGEGTHNELILNNDVYKELFNAQSKYYKEEVSTDEEAI